MIPSPLMESFGLPFSVNPAASVSPPLSLFKGSLAVSASSSAVNSPPKSKTFSDTVFSDDSSLSTWGIPSSITASPSAACVPSSAAAMLSETSVSIASDSSAYTTLRVLSGSKATVNSNARNPAINLFPLLFTFFESIIKNPSILGLYHK